MKLQQIKELIEIIEKSGVAELNITEDGEAIHIERSQGQPPPPSSLPTEAIATTANAPAPDHAADPWGGDHVVRSPMVGTFYRAATAGADPFVAVGDGVQDGDVLGVISALQIKNRIRAQARGRVRAMLVEDAQPVEYDQPLLVISPWRETH